MKRLLILLLALVTLTSAACAEELITLGEPLSDVICWPDGSDETTAAYVYRYSYPQVAGDSEIAALINGVYDYEVEYTRSFRVPMNAGDLDPDGNVQYYTTVTSEVTCLNERYLSVLTTTETFMGMTMSPILSARTFSLQGNASSGAETNLPYLMGLLGEDDDEWMQDRQTARADACVRRLIWETIEQQMRDGAVTFDDGLEPEWLTWVLFPETDYYLDADGNPVFFIQAGDIAPVTEGVLLYPFTMEELLDEI